MYAKSVLTFLGGTITNYRRNTTYTDLCYSLLPVQYTELAHQRLNSKSLLITVPVRIVQDLIHDGIRHFSVISIEYEKSPALVSCPSFRFQQLQTIRKRYWQYREKVHLESFFVTKFNDSLFVFMHVFVCWLVMLVS